MNLSGPLTARLNMVSGEPIMRHYFGGLFLTLLLQLLSTLRFQLQTTREQPTKRMVQSLKLSLYNFSTLKVIYKAPETRALSFVKVRAMSSKSSSPPPPINGNIVNGSSNGNGNGHLGDDTRKIEKMTVQQLRSKLRDVGVPSKGSKAELISALRSFMDLHNGECTTLLEEAEMESVVKRSSKRTLRKDHLLNELNIEASGTKRFKKREPYGELKASSTAFRKEAMSVETLQMEDKRDDNEVQDKVSDKAKRKVRSKNVETTEIADPSVSQNEPWTVFAHKKPQEGWVAYNPKHMRQPPLNEDTKHLKLMSWNVNGLRALLKLDTFHALAQRENFDVLCLQETKLQERDVEAIKQSLLDGYQYSYWTCSVSKLGYSGTAVISRIKPVSVRYGLGISDHDTEGRLVTVEFDDFFLLNGYVPNSGDGLKRLSYRVTQWDTSLGIYMKELEKSKPVILTGDLNCAHEEIDIYNPAGNKRSAGFTIEERQSFEANFLNKGFVDTFRRQHPGVVGYTYWGYRHGGRKHNRGWRLDYFLVSESVANNVHDSYIVPDVTGSDHCPLGLVLKL